jgi:NADPH2:quinone reductase
MKAVWYTRQGPAREVLVFGEREAPVPDVGEVLVRVLRSGVRNSQTRSPTRASSIPGPTASMTPAPSECGTTLAAGIGWPVHPERFFVSCGFRADSSRKGGGTAAEFAVMPSIHAIRLPDDVSFDIGACLGVPAMTAHAALFSDGPVTGQTVLIQGGAGAVGQYAIQFARWNGARVITTVSSDEKAALAARLGADAVVNYRRENVVERVRDFAGPEGVDRIVEVDFGANLAIDHAVIRDNGTIASYSSTRDPEPKLPYYAFARKGVTLHFVQGKILTEAARAHGARDITVLMERKILRHPETRLYPLNDTAAAHEELESGTFTGKVLVAPAQD